MSIVAGIDFGTLSVRVSIVDTSAGIVGAAAATYPLHKDRSDPDHASQSHSDQMAALQSAMREALANSHVAGSAIAALAVAATGSSVVPVDRHLQPLGEYYLWCDHRATREAAEITQAARDLRLPALAWCGGSYSPEWGFAKVLHWLRHNPQSRGKFFTALEHGDMVVATLCGIDARRLSRGVCAMGHKWMWNDSLGGLPSQAFLDAVDPLFDGVREKLGGSYGTADRTAGYLSAEWASRLGLQPGLPIPYSELDAHTDAVGAGIHLGDIVNVLGTSTCVMALSEHAAPIPGVAGVVSGSIHPKLVGIEAGLSACGAVFDSIAARSGRSLAELAKQAENHQPGQSGLLRLPWDNGDRTILAKPNLRGLTLGWNLSHSAADELFAAMEGTAFQTKIIIDHLGEHHVPARRVVNAGGLAQHMPALNQIYADILNLTIRVPNRQVTGLGSAIFAALAAGAFSNLDAAQDALCPAYREYSPSLQAAATYAPLYQAFRRMYFLLGDGGETSQAYAGVLETLRAVASSAMSGRNG
jgi:L-ribulokinase